MATKISLLTEMWPAAMRGMIPPPIIQRILFSVIILLGTLLGKYRGTNWPGCPPAARASRYLPTVQTVDNPRWFVPRDPGLMRLKTVRIRGKESPTRQSKAKQIASAAIVNYIHQIISFIRKAQEIATQHGFKNLLQPGLVKELVVADILGHEVHKTKHEPDAFDPANPERKFEYLSCFEGGTFQLDRMFSSPPYKRATSLERITRNTAIYCAVFDKESPLDVLTIYEVPVDAMLREAERQLDASRNEISHVGFTINWAQRNGKLVYPKQA